MQYRFDDIAINVTQKKKPTSEDRQTYVGLEHLDPGNFIVSRFGSEITPKGIKLVMKKGDVLFGKRRAYQRKVAIAPFDGIFSAHGMVLRPNEKVIDREFFPLFIGSDYFLETAIKISVGSLSPTVNWNDLKEIVFKVPILSEQRQLAKILWSIKKTIELYSSLLFLMDQLSMSQFIEMFKPYLNDGVRLEDMCLSITKGTTPTTVGFDFQDEGVNFIKIESITDDGHIITDKIAHISNECHATFERSQLVEGDVLFSIAGTIGRVAIVGKNVLPANTNQALSIIRLKEDVVNLNYFLQVLKSDIVSRQYTGSMRGAAQVNLSLGDISDFRIPLPPIELQEQFSSFVKQVDKSKFERLCSLCIAVTSCLSCYFIYNCPNAFIINDNDIH